MQHTKKGEELTKLIVETFRLNGAIIEAGDALVKDLGITSARWQVLACMVNGPATVSEIARLRGLSRQNVQRIANRLATDGFIESLENPAHRRAKLFQLTPKGQETMAEVAKRQKHWANRASEALDLEMLTTVVSQMKVYIQAIGDTGPTP